jgi:hypothetical protein
VFAQLYDEDAKTARRDLGFRDEDNVWHDAAELGYAMLTGYVDKYGEDDQYEVIASEQVFKIDIGTLTDGDPITYVGTLDGVWRDRTNKRIVFVDYKTAKTIDLRHLPLDEQAGAYWTFGPAWLRKKGILGRDQDISHIMYTFLRKAKPDSRPTNAAGNALNKDGSVSKVQPSPLFERVNVYRDEYDKVSVRQRVLAEVGDMDHVLRNQRLAYKNPGKFTCGMGCAFAGMCEIHETGGDWPAIRDSDFTTWDPYETYGLDPKELMR